MYDKFIEGAPGTNQQDLQPFPATSTYHGNGAVYTAAEWDIRCRLEKIEQLLARVIKNQENPAPQIPPDGAETLDR